jgi:hypothetical protein
VDVSVPETAADVQALGWRELQIVAARLIGQTPAIADSAATIASVVPPIVNVSGTSESSPTPADVGLCAGPLPGRAHRLTGRTAALYGSVIVPK